MSNMGYCRFENTLPDLLDCEDHMEDNLRSIEFQARKKLIKACVRIAEQWGDFEFEEITEDEDE
jgi:hypothetical protein